MENIEELFNAGILGRRNSTVKVCQKLYIKFQAKTRMENITKISRMGQCSRKMPENAGFLPINVHSPSIRTGHWNCLD